MRLNTKDLDNNLPETFLTKDSAAFEGSGEGRDENWSYFTSTAHITWEGEKEEAW